MTTLGSCAILLQSGKYTPDIALKQNKHSFKFKLGLYRFNLYQPFVTEEGPEGGNLHENSTMVIMSKKLSVLTKSLGRTDLTIKGNIDLARAKSEAPVNKFII